MASVQQRSAMKRKPATLPRQREEVIGTHLKERFEDFVGSLGEALLDMTALEVNTMVVSHISGHKFTPEEAYCMLYEIGPAYFQAKRIPGNLQPRYEQLRAKLEVEYKQLTNVVEGCGEHIPLPDPENPADQRRLQKILENGRFLRALRKLRELKNALDSDDPSSPHSDLILAQTVMQLDGDILNRYHQRVFDPDFAEFRDVLLKVHKEGVLSGEEQWHGLLSFMVGLIRNLLPPSARPTSSDSSTRNGRR